MASLLTYPFTILRQAAIVAPKGKADFGALQPCLTAGAVVLRRIATQALEALLHDVGIDPQAVLKKHVSERPTHTSVSVLNVYHYNNTPGGDAANVAANCPEHTDPGLITVLACGTADGLQVATGRSHDTACCTGTDPYHNVQAPREDQGSSAGEAVEDGGSEVAWVTMEPLMQPHQVLVLVGESLRRLTGGVLPACLHRVVHHEEGAARLNAIFELRPSVPIFEAWPS